MTVERWKDLAATIKDRFTIETSGREPFTDGPGEVEFLTFTAPTGKIRLEFVTRPLVTGKHTAGGRRTGVATAVSYDYSDHEFTHSFHAYQWLNNEWSEIDAQAFA